MHLWVHSVHQIWNIYSHYLLKYFVSISFLFQELQLHTCWLSGITPHVTYALYISVESAYSLQHFA